MELSGKVVVVTGAGSGMGQLHTQDTSHLTGSTRSTTEPSTQQLLTGLLQ